MPPGEREGMTDFINQRKPAFQQLLKMRQGHLC